MSLLLHVVFTSLCRSTHHKLAIDALRHLQVPDSDRWVDVFLRYHAAYLEGAKAPDDKFKDFRNHVLHVQDNYWGGAVATAQKWYDATVQAFRNHLWEEAVYSAGVLSHYYSDPLMPLHTGQSEAEGAVHRALEWSVTKSYGELQQIIDRDQGGYPRVDMPDGDDWLQEMIHSGARLANSHYDVLIDHYNLAEGVRNPLLGLDQECKDRVARCLGTAVIGFSRILERAITEGNVQPPWVELTLRGLMATAKIPFETLRKRLEDSRQKAFLEVLYAEFSVRGKVIDNLPADEAEVRRLHAAEVLKTPIEKLDAEKPRAPGTLFGTGAAERRNSNKLVSSPVIDNRRRRKKKPIEQLPELTEPINIAALLYSSPLSSTTYIPRSTRYSRDTSETSASSDSTAASSRAEKPVTEKPAAKQPEKSHFNQNQPSEASKSTTRENSAAASVPISPDVSKYVPISLPPREKLKNQFDRDASDNDDEQSPADVDDREELPVSKSRDTHSRDTVILQHPLADHLAQEQAERELQESAASDDIAAIEQRPSRLRSWWTSATTKASSAARSATSAARTATSAATTAAKSAAKSAASKAAAVFRRSPKPTALDEQTSSLSIARDSEPDIEDQANMLLARDEQAKASDTPPSRSSVLKSAAASSGDKFKLNRKDAVVDAPSIGEKTSQRLHSVGVRTVGDLLEANPMQLATKLRMSHITADTIRQWQKESTLCCRMPGIAGHDSQILIASGIESPEDLAELGASEVLDLIQPFLESSEGKRVLRSSTPPDREEVTNWIAWAKKARQLKAA